MHNEAYRYVSQTLKNFTTRKRIVDLGGRNVNGSVHKLFPYAEKYVAVDIRDGLGVDVICDAAEYVPDFTPDAVVCCEVLEHTPPSNGMAIIDNAYRMLSRYGVLIVTAACEPRKPHSAVDGEELQPNEYYGNVNPNDLDVWMQQFPVRFIKTDTIHGDVYATGIKYDGSYV